MATFEIDEKRFDIIKEAVSSDCISFITMIFWVINQTDEFLLFV